jgi:hypothetical protein
LTTRIIHISVGGPDREIEVNGKRVLFEDHPRFGPTPISRRNFAVLSKAPSRAFWDAIERWTLAGKPVDGQVAIVPAWCAECRGDGWVVDPVRGGKWVVPCPSCEGQKIKRREAQTYKGDGW